MPNPHPNDPLHGITLETIVIQLKKHYGWEGLGERIDIRCFTSRPSVKSSLQFLRRTPWARKKVEDLYLIMPKPTPAAEPEPAQDEASKPAEDPETKS